MTHLTVGIILMSFYASVFWAALGFSIIQKWTYPEKTRQFAIMALLCGPVGIIFWGGLWVVEKLKNLYDKP